MLATGFLSMWISNTATTMMMVPIALAIISQLSVFFSREKELSVGMAKNRDNLGVVLLLSIAYSASIGGLATLIGTPTNIIFSGFVEDFYQSPESFAFLETFQMPGFEQSAVEMAEISFMEWFKVGFPIAAIMLLLTWFFLVRVAFPLSNEPLTAGKKEINQQLAALGKISTEEKRVLIVFTITALLWMLRKPLTGWFSPWLDGLDDNIIALLGGLSLFVIPGTEKGKFVMDWKTANKLPWGILLLFGGGFALATGFKESELANWIATGLESLNGIHVFIFILAITTLVNFLTELTMNMATVTMILPILAALAISTGLNPLGLMVAATMAGSCAFMLPVATAPNAIVFGAGYIKMKDMIRAGFALNLISILLISLVVYFLLGLFWHIQMI
jgi:sodium-dependent dicarboxylate transporter 2/3/5